MKRLLSLLLIAGTLCACGGGGNGNGDGSVLQGPAPAVKVLSPNLSRMVVGGTSVAMEVVIRPNFTPAGTMYATATDAAGVIRPPVEVSANSDGSYTLSMTTSTTAAPQHYTGTATVNLFSDEGRTKPQAVPTIDVPYDITVLASASASWPGNHLTALSPWAGIADWSTFQGNAAHTGYVAVSVDPNAFSTRWLLSTTGTSVSNRYGLPAAPTTAAGNFFTSGSNKLYARKEFDGSLAWQYDCSSLQFPSVNPPAVADGVVYMAAGQQSSTFMYGFNSSDGSVLFKTPMSSQWEHYLAPTIGDQRVYTNAGSFGGLYAFGSSGQPLFYKGLPQTSMWTPAVDATGVYTYTGGGLTVMDPKTGETLASISDPSFANYVYEIGGSPVLGAPGSVFAANYANSALNSGTIGNTLLKFDVNKKAIAWQVKGVYPTTPAYANGVLYAASNMPLQLEARAEADGALLWSWVPPLAGDGKFASEVLLTKNLAFLSTNVSTYAVDLSTHRTVWSYPLSGRLSLSQNGTLYIQGTTSLVAINLK